LKDSSEPWPGSKLRAGATGAGVRPVTRSLEKSRRASTKRSPGSVACWGKGDDLGQVNLTINSRPFAVTCDDGEETRIRRLGQYVDAKVAEFVGNIGQVGEARLLLLAALVIADELADANEALRLERSGMRQASATAAAASSINGIAQRVEAIAARLETS
jgi:cell division protein ZapA